MVEFKCLYIAVRLVCVALQKDEVNMTIQLTVADKSLSQC